MAQEPKSKQREIDKVYELVVLNHTFLSSLSSLSTYIQHQKTTETSEQFKEATQKIEKKLGSVLQGLKEKKGNYVKDSVEKETYQQERLSDFNFLNNKNLKYETKETARRFQEAHLVGEQLQWLFDISCKMLKLSVTVNKN